MESWEEELELDVSDIWTGGVGAAASAAAASVRRQKEEDDDDDDLGFGGETQNAQEDVVMRDAAEDQKRQLQQQRQKSSVVVSQVSPSLVGTQKKNPHAEEEEEEEKRRPCYISHQQVQLPLPLGAQQQNRSSTADDTAAFVSQTLHPSLGTQNCRNREDDRRAAASQVPPLSLGTRNRCTKEDSRAAAFVSQIPPPPPLAPQPSLGTQNPSTTQDRRVSSVPSQDSSVPRKWWGDGNTSGGVAVRGELKRSSKIPGPAGDLRRGRTVDKGGGGIPSSPSKKGKHSCDDEFKRGPWLAALKALDVAEFDPVRYPVLKSTVSTIKASPSQAQVPNFVAVIKELRRNDYGDASVLLKDPTGTIQGCISHKVLSDLKFGSNIGPGAVIILMKVAIFRPSPSAHYLNVTINNVVKVLGVEMSLPTQQRVSDTNRFNMWSQFQQDILPVTAPSEKICKEPANAPEKTYSQVLAVPDKNNTATAAKLAGWDHADDLEDILNDDVDNFFA
ncbi:unnamed protein product [Sphagnum jensenii]|uniref:Homologous recombination OB-fold protein OB-fold domain-containing protein n=1 Tax=Sphagnum jensenii TaxID=128206 RepID=A0ABP0WUB8_9BRYO